MANGINNTSSKASWLVAGAAISLGLNLLLGGMALRSGDDRSVIEANRNRIVSLEVTVASLRSDFAATQATLAKIETKMDKLIDSFNNHMKESR